MDTSKEYIYKQRFYPIPVCGGKWVELWNMCNENEKLRWERARIELDARVEKSWRNWR